MEIVVAVERLMKVKEIFGAEFGTKLNWFLMSETFEREFLQSR